MIAALLLPAVLCACDGDSIALNSLGYNYIASNYQAKKSQPVTIPSSSAKQVNGLKPYGIGLPPESFQLVYGNPLGPSQPPTQYWFRATLDDFPAGSVAIVGFDRSSLDSAPRANQISYVAGNRHRTTVTQAETIAVSYLPADTQGPTPISKYDAHAQRCQSEYLTSATLAKLFPPQDFQDADGKAAKAGTVTLSLFPLYDRSTASGNEPYESRGLSGLSAGA